jgi:hypothetical protein
MSLDDPAKVRDTLTKVVLPLVTQLNNTAPIQYIAVKWILVLLQKYRRMLASEVSIFFLKCDDPLYMKLVKQKGPVITLYMGLGRWNQRHRCRMWSRKIQSGREKQKRLTRVTNRREEGRSIIGFEMEVRGHQITCLNHAISMFEQHCKADQTTPQSHSLSAFFQEELNRIVKLIENKVFDFVVNDPCSVVLLSH